EGCLTYTEDGSPTDKTSRVSVRVLQRLFDVGSHLGDSDASCNAGVGSGAGVGACVDDSHAARQIAARLHTHVMRLAAHTSCHRHRDRAEHVLQVETFDPVEIGTRTDTERHNLSEELARA